MTGTSTSIEPGRRLRRGLRPQLSAASLGLAWTGAAAAGIAAVQLGSTAVIARHLSPADYGVVGIATVLVGLLIAVAQGGIAQALVHEREICVSHESAALALATLWGALWWAGISLAAPSIAHALSAPRLVGILQCLAPCIFLRALTGVSEGLLLRKLQFKEIAVAEAVSYAVAYLFVGIPLALLGFREWSLVWAYVVNNLGRSAWLIASARPSINARDRRDAARELMAFAGGQTIAQTSNYVASEGDNLVVGGLLGAAALGVYGRAYQLAIAPANLASSLVDRVFYPILVRARNAGQPLGPVFMKWISGGVLVLVPFTVGITVTAPEIVAVILGPSWQGAVRPLQILSIGLFFRGIFQICDCFCRAAGAIYGSGIRQALYAVCVVGGAILGTKVGPSGVAAGVVLAMAIKCFAMLQLSLRALELRLGDLAGPIIPSVGLALFSAMVFALAVIGGRNTGAPALAVMALAGVCGAATATFAALQIKARHAYSR